MITRRESQNLKIYFREFPIVALLGPRQVGKTTLVKELAAKNKKQTIYLDLEKASDRQRLQDPQLFFQSHRDKLVILDEIQQMPELFTALRPEIDEWRKPGRFLLTGSASPELVKGVSETLAGRIAYRELTPINSMEADKAGYTINDHWFRGGFPPALTAKNNASWGRWAENFIHSYVEGGLSAFFGVQLTPSIIQNFWNMLSVSNGNIWNAEIYARSLGISSPTVSRYLDFMEGAYLIRRLPAWYVNSKKRLVKSPKIYLRDTGILHFMNHLSTLDELPGNPIAGASWEGYVIEEICRILPPGIRPFYYRTHHGAEADLVLVRGIKPIYLIEIKYGLAPSISNGFYQCMADLKTFYNAVIYSGDEKYKNKQGVIFTSLKDFLKSIEIKNLNIN